MNSLRMRAIKELAPRMGVLLHVAEKDNPVSFGVPVPTCWGGDWVGYVAAYDPFNWSGKHFSGNYKPKGA